MTTPTPQQPESAAAVFERAVNELFCSIEQRGSKVKDAQFNVVGYFVGADLLRELRATHRAQLATALAQPDTLGDGDGVGERDLRLDNADLARQLSDACARRADAYDEGYDTAMQHAHHVLNRLGYLERLAEDNGNPYRIATQPSATSERGGQDE